MAKRSRSNGGLGSFAGIPRVLMESQKYKQLNGWEVRLLLELACQFRGSNNGDLGMTWTMAKERGWRSSGTLAQSLAKLEALGFILRTREGGKHRCSLYALSWQPIDDCGGKLDVKATATAPNTWKTDVEKPWHQERKNNF